MWPKGTGWGHARLALICRRDTGGSEAKVSLGRLRCRGKNVDQAWRVTRFHPSWPGPAPIPTGVPGVTEPCPPPHLLSLPSTRSVPEPSLALPAVGPPLLTLVNFEVENLAYMLVCMQWRVSGPCSGPPGVQPWWQEVGASGSSPCPRVQTGVCACNSEAHACRGRANVCPGPGMVSSPGVGICWADSVRHWSLGQGFPRLSSSVAPSLPCSACRARPLPFYLAEKTKAQSGAVSCPGL